MGSLLEELARREAAVRLRIEEIGERIAELNELLEAEEDRLSRLVITRETVEGVLGEAAGVDAGPVDEAVSVGMVRAAGVPASPIGVLTVPPWRPGMRTSVLPEAYRDAVEIVADAAAPMRAGQIAAAMGLQDSAAKREGLRSKLKRLVERGWATENEPGLFVLPGPVARELAAGPGKWAGGRAGRRAGRYRLVTGGVIAAGLFPGAGSKGDQTRKTNPRREEEPAVEHYDIAAGVDRFAAARNTFNSLIGQLVGPRAMDLPHDRVEEALAEQGRELLRLLLQAHLDLRADRERAGAEHLRGTGAGVTGALQRLPHAGAAHRRGAAGPER